MLRLLFPLLFGLTVLAQPIAASETDEISVDAFFGAWSGNVDVVTMPRRDTFGSFDYKTKWDIDIKIRSKGKGFNLSWLMYIHRGRDTEETDFWRRDSINFVPTEKPGVFAPVGLDDPLAESDYVWAQVEGQTLFVYSPIIDWRGDYHQQVWNLTLTGGGRGLDFLSINKTRPEHPVKGKLVKRAS